MKTQIYFLVLIFGSMGLLSACSSLEVAGYDRAKNIVSVKTGKLDSKGDAKEEAGKYCASKVTLLNPDEKADAQGITVYQFTCDR